MRGFQCALRRSPVAASSLRRLFEEQHRFLDYFFEHLEYEPLELFCRVRSARCFFGGTIGERIKQLTEM